MKDNAKSCGQCVFFEYVDLRDRVVLRCRRYPPTAAGWPLVHAVKDWCGEFKRADDTPTGREGGA